MQRQPRTIVLVRHAKAEQVGTTDFERELSPRGHADAAAAGRWLAGQGVVPDHALVSASVRTRQTWEALAGAAGWAVEGTFDRGLYAAGAETALDLVREVPGEARSVVVIGHNPTIADLAQLLDDGTGDPTAADEMARGYPTGGSAVFEYDGDWADLDQESARLVAFHVPRG